MYYEVTGLEQWGKIVPSQWVQSNAPQGVNIPYQRTNSPTGRNRGLRGSG